MAARHTIRILDHDGEATAFGLPGPDLTAGNIAAQIILWDALVTAVQAVIIGNVAFKSLQAYVTEVDNTNPADGFAQRETKWLLGWTNTSTGEKHTTEIGTSDLDLLGTGVDTLDLAAGAGLALKTAFEAVVRGGAAGTNTVTLDYVRHVGRNL